MFLGSALFDPRNVGATGRKLQINSDARYAFERGVDPASAVMGIEAGTRMILALCGGEPSEVVVGGTPPDYRRTIAFDPARVATLGGLELPAEEIKGILTRLGFSVTIGSPWSVAPPSWRSRYRRAGRTWSRKSSASTATTISTPVPMPRRAHAQAGALSATSARSAYTARACWRGAASTRP